LYSRFTQQKLSILVVELIGLIPFVQKDWQNKAEVKVYDLLMPLSAMEPK